MKNTTATTESRLTAMRETPPDDLDRLRQNIEQIAHLLPAQGPITVFVHHNTLHAFEDLPFEKAVIQGLETFGCQPYLPEDRYREMLSRDRIRLADLEAVLEENLGDQAEENLLGLGRRRQLRLQMPVHPLRSGSPAELRWLVAHTDALRQFRKDIPEATRQQVLEKTQHWILRDVRNGTANGHTPNVSPATTPAKNALAEIMERYGVEKIEYWNKAIWEAVTLQALWRACRHGVHGRSRPEANPSAVRPRDLLQEITGIDSDQFVNELLIRFCAAFLDQGAASWSLPNREQGFYRSFTLLYQQPGGPPERWMRVLRRELSRLNHTRLSPLGSIEESLKLLGIHDSERETFLSQMLSGSGPRKSPGC